MIPLLNYNTFPLPVSPCIINVNSMMLTFLHSNYDVITSTLILRLLLAELHSTMHVAFCYVNSTYLCRNKLTALRFTRSNKYWLSLQVFGHHILPEMAPN